MKTNNTVIKLWWHNNVKRHWNNFWLKRYWIAEGRDPNKFFGGGKISQECLDWADNAISEIDNTGEG